MNQVMLLYLYVNKVCMLKCNTVYSVHFIIFDVSTKRSMIILATIFYIYKSVIIKLPMKQLIWHSVL